MTQFTRREFAALASASAVSLGTGLVVSGCTATTGIRSAKTFDPVTHVNAELRSMVPFLQQLTLRDLSLKTLADRRKEEFAFPLLPQPQWTERNITGPTDAPDVRIYIVNAAPRDRLRPAILYIHGGGFVIGGASTSLRQVQERSVALDCVVVSVDYRLAPETRFPGSLEDNYAALKWLYHNAAELGVDQSKIAVMGESAGGGHAAMLAIAARDRGEVPLLFQALVYPMLDDRTGSTREVPSHIGTLIWNGDKNRFGWTSFLGVTAGSAHVPHGAVPARIEDLHGLPATFIGVGSIDLFASEDIQYALRLIDAGVPTELNVVPGAYHGFDIAVPKASVSTQFKAALNSALARGFART